MVYSAKHFLQKTCIFVQKRYTLLKVIFTFKSFFVEILYTRNVNINMMLKNS
jgi:hypothetical protein